MLIGEVAEQTGISARMLRHYDAINLVSPTGRTVSGYRQYADHDLVRLFHVEALRSLGLSLREISTALGHPSFDPVALIDQLRTRTEERLQQEQELLARLTRVQASSPTAWSDVVDTLGLMRRLASSDASTRQQFALSQIQPRTNDVPRLVEALLIESDQNVAGALQWAVARTGDAAITELEQALDHPDPRSRQRAVDALLKIGSSRAAAVLASRLHHADPVVSRQAALSRGAGGRSDAIPALVRLVAEGKRDAEAVEVLSRLASSGVSITERIVEAIADAIAVANRTSRRHLAAALAEVSTPRAREALQDLVNDPDTGVAATASFLVRQSQRPAENPTPTDE